MFGFGKKKDNTAPIEGVPKKEINKEEKLPENNDVIEENQFFETMGESRGVVTFLHNLVLYSIYKQLIGLSVFSTILLGVSAVGLFSLGNITVKPEFIEIDQENRIAKELPLNQPNMSDGEIIGETKSAVRKINTYSYANKEEQLADLEELFTQEGWKSFTNALVASGNLKAVDAGKNIVRVEFTGLSQIETKRETGVGFVWKVLTPVKIYYIAPNTQLSRDRTQEGIVELYWVRVPFTEKKKGIGILRYNLDTSRKSL